jgi:hypothetical protein
VAADASTGDVYVVGYTGAGSSVLNFGGTSASVTRYGNTDAFLIK